MKRREVVQVWRHVCSSTLVQSHSPEVGSSLQECCGRSVFQVDKAEEVGAGQMSHRCRIGVVYKVALADFTEGCGTPTPGTNISLLTRRPRLQSPAYPRLPMWMRRGCSGGDRLPNADPTIEFAPAVFQLGAACGQARGGFPVPPPPEKNGRATQPRSATSNGSLYRCTLYDLTAQMDRLPQAFRNAGF